MANRANTQITIYRAAFFSALMVGAGFTVGALYASWWGLLVGSAFLVVGGALGIFGRTIGAFVSLAGAVAIGFLVAVDEAPGWALLGALGGAVPFVAVLPRLARLDKLASLAIALVFTGGATAATLTTDHYAPLSPIPLSLDSEELAPAPAPTAEELSAEAEAWRDIVRGDYELRTFGYPAAWREQYARLLADRYGVMLVPVAGCVVTPELVRGVEAYNDVMEAEIERLYGSDALANAARDARAMHRELHPEFY